MLSKRLSGGPILQTGWEPLIYIIHPTGQSPLSDSITGLLVLGMRLGWGEREDWKAQRRSSQSSWGNRPCADGTIKEQYPADMMEACSGNLEPLISDRDLGWAGKAATLVRYQKAPLQPWPGHPPAVGDDDNTGLAELRWAAFALVSCLPSGITVLPLFCSCPHQMLQEEPCDTPPPTEGACISVGSSVSSLSTIGDKR